MINTTSALDALHSPDIFFMICSKDKKNMSSSAFYNFRQNLFIVQMRQSVHVHANTHLDAEYL